MTVCQTDCLRAERLYCTPVSTSLVLGLKSCDHKCWDQSWELCSSFSLDQPHVPQGRLELIEICLILPGKGWD